MPSKSSDAAPPGNPLGTAGGIISLLGAVLCIGAVAWSYSLEDPNRPHDSFLGMFFAALDSLGVVLVLGVVGLVGGTLCLVGTILSAGGLGRLPNELARLGIVAGLLGPSMLIVRLIFWLW